MTAAHYHLLLVHIPVLFVPFALVLLVVGLWCKQFTLQRLAAVIFLASALVAIPTFLTGEPAEEQIEGFAEVSEPIIEEHEEAAEAAFYVTLAAGALALGVLVSNRRAKLQRNLQIGLAIAGLVSSLALLRTANFGGQIRHSEIRGGK